MKEEAILLKWKGQSSFGIDLDKVGELS